VFLEHLLLVSRRGSDVIVQLMGGANERFVLEHDEQGGTLALGVLGSRDSFTLARTVHGNGRLLLERPFGAAGSEWSCGRSMMPPSR
jgi:hypothetical protein